MVAPTLWIKDHSWVEKLSLRINFELVNFWTNKLQTCEFHAGTDLEGPQKGLVENDRTHNWLHMTTRFLCTRDWNLVSLPFNLVWQRVFIAATTCHMRFHPCSFPTHPKLASLLMISVATETKGRCVRRIAGVQVGKDRLQFCCTKKIVDCLSNEMGTVKPTAQRSQYNLCAGMKHVPKTKANIGHIGSSESSHVIKCSWHFKIWKIYLWCWFGTIFLVL